MRRLLLLGLATIALLVAGSLLWISRLDGPGPAAPPRVLGGPAPTAAPAADPPPIPDRPLPPLAATQPASPAPAAPQAASWESIEPSGLQAWPRLFSTLGAARPRLAPCFDEANQARYGARTYSTVGEAPAGPGPATLLLNVEADADGRLRLVDAPVERRGAEQDGLFSCVQERLRGMVLPGEGVPGARYRIRFPLSPTGMGPAAQPVRGPRVRPTTE